MSERKPQEIGERAFEFAVRVVRLCQMLDKTAGVPRTLANQLLRSATSVGANLEEAKGGQSPADYLSKVFIALKESRETHYWLRLLIATDIVPEAQLTPLREESNELVAILTTIVKKLKAKSTPISPPSGPAPRLLQGPPSKSKFLAAGSRILLVRR